MGEFIVKEVTQVKFNSSTEYNNSTKELSVVSCDSITEISQYLPMDSVAELFCLQDYSKYAIVGERSDDVFRDI